MRSANVEKEIVPLTERQRGMVSENIGLVRMLVRRLSPRRCRMHGDDLASAGFDGLIKAAKGFDDARGIKFCTYAARAIWNEMRQEVYRVRLRHPCQQLSSRRDREVADRPRFPGHGQEVRELCGVAMNSLSDRQRFVLEMIELEGTTGAQLANTIGVQRQRVNQIHREAKDKARAAVQKATGELALA